MSTRALRKLERKAAAAPGAAAAEESEDSDSAAPPSPPQRNVFALLADEEDSDGQADQDDASPASPAPTQPKKTSKAKKKKAKKAAATAAASDDIDAILKEIGPAKAAAEGPAPAEALETGDLEGLKSLEDLRTEAELFKIQHRNLNPNTELRQIFGAALGKLEMERLGEGGSGRSGRRRGGPGRSGPQGGKLVEAKPDWPPPQGTGLGMEKLADGRFRFTHSKDYQRAQLFFRQAVETMDHEAFMGILRQENPYHVDSLLQLAEVARINEDAGQARDFVERALYAHWAAFHPLFNLTTFTSRLDYAQLENRGFFLALWRHMQGLVNRGCPKTALEFAKLIYSLAPRQDPLGVLLILDFLALKARRYDLVLELYAGLEVSRNLSQLPSWNFSVALARFLTEGKGTAADSALEAALIRFPSQLYWILDKCSVEPDAEVAKAKVFGVEEAGADAKGLQLLETLYAVRTAPLWKEEGVLAWVEGVVRGLLPRLPKDPQLALWRQKRRKNYARAPVNVQRHVVVSELGREVGLGSLGLAERDLRSFDPLPPSDSRCEYSLEGPEAPAGQNGFLDGLLRSLMPNYTPEAAAAADAERRDEPGQADQPLPQRAQALMVAMRDMLNNVQLQPPEREDQHLPPDHQDPDPDWD